MGGFYNRASVVALSVFFAFSSGLVVVHSASAATRVDLGSADDFAILAGSTVTNTGGTVISGDLGLSPGTSVTGFPPGTLNGTEHVADAEAVQAQTDLTTAYNDAAGQTPVSTVPTELGGTTLKTGIYDSSAGTFGITGTLTLDGEGDADAVFIFNTESTLITAESSVVSLINGAQACNVFWQVGSSATLGTNSTFKGSVLALTSVTLNAGADVEGRILARDAAITLDTNTITKATCVTPPETPDVPETPAVPPLIDVLKVPDPLALPDGEGPVTYTYTVSNPGTVAMSNITVSDNKCDDVEFNSGDTNDDSNLDVDETWEYSCTRTLAKTMTNTVTATGEANGFTISDTANATVVVGVEAVPPLIHIVKTPDDFLITTGDTVTYTYSVTNPGDVALSDVSVIDDKCSPVTFVSGDDNDNDKLNDSETWIYTCEVALTETTTNIATAEGTANGLTVIDFSTAIVVTEDEAVTEEDTTTEEDTSTTEEDTTTTETDTTNTSTGGGTTSAEVIPTFPNTGVGPVDNTIPWKTAATVLILASIVFYAVRRKQTV